MANLERESHKKSSNADSSKNDHFKVGGLSFSLDEEVSLRKKPNITYVDTSLGYDSVQHPKVKTSKGKISGLAEKFGKSETPRTV